MSRSSIIIIVILLTGIAGWLYIKYNGVSKGEIVPNFSEELIDGSAFNISDLRGNYVLIDFWGSWCPPCRTENPKLVELYIKYNGKEFKNANGFEIVSIALEKNDRNWEQAVAKDGLNWNYQIVQVSKLVVMSPLARLFGVTDLPTKILVDPRGNIIGKMSLTDLDAYLNSSLKQ